MQLKNKYYLYKHVRIDNGNVFYIGIGTKKNKLVFNTIKLEYSRAYIKSNRNSIWNNIIAKTDYRVEILLESNIYKEIQDKEIEYINLYGRINKNNGCLANMTNGGEHNNGRIRSKECCIKQSIFMKNYWNKIPKEDRVLKQSKIIMKAQKALKLKGYPKKYLKGRLHIDKKVINLESGIIHNSIKEVYKTYNIPFSKSHLVSMLSNKYKNKTNFKLL